MKCFIAGVIREVTLSIEIGLTVQGEHHLLSLVNLVGNTFISYKDRSIVHSS